MQKWEYCAVTDFICSGKAQLAGIDAWLTAFTLDGVTATHVRNMAQLVAELGMDGWEMVGCGNTSEYSHNLYFKRPKE